MLAQRYIEDIKDSEADERAIKQHMKEALEDKKAGNITTDAYRDLVENLEDELFQNRVDRVIASRNIVEQLTNDLRSSVQAAIDFQARERQRVEDIQHNANSDLEGRKCDEHIRPTAIDHAMNSQWLRFPTAPMANFVMMLRMIGGKNIRGEGYLYNRFMRQWVDATDAEWRNWKQASAELDAKAKEVTGKKRWSDLYDITRKKGATISFWDGDEMKEHELTQGNLMYMYMAAKMKDGRVKLNAMGLTDAEIVNVSQALDPRLKTLADWLQEEYLPMKRKAYNQVHVRMFGAPMAGIDNYFPLKILSNARKQDVDVNGAQQEQLPGEVTENIIKRKHNITPLDILGTDAVSLTVEHIQRMENWRAFAEFRRDLKILLSYKKFRNRLKNMHSVQYGSGEELWKNFVDVCTIAAGQYRPSDARLDRAFNTLGKMVTGAKIAFLPYTALKQLTSFPAYLSSSNWAALTASTAMWPTAFTWAMKNLPTFSKRWESRQAGNYLLKDMTNWAYSQKRFIEKLIRAGMTPNAFIDGLTVAIGARAIFWTKQRQYKALGYSPEDARKRALQDAAISVNETQQSGEGAFMSPMQASRTSLGSLVSMFRNSPFGYTRQVTDAIRNMKNFLELKNAKDRIAFRTKQLVRDGIDEEDAKKFAWAEYGKTPARESIRFAVFAWGLQFLWDLMPNMIYLLTGDDDDEKDAIVEDAMQHALWGGIEGFSGGNLISDNGHMLVSGSDLGNANFTVSPLMSDIQTIFKHLKSDQVMAYNDIFNLAIQAKLGVNPQAIEGVAEAFYDACNGDPETMHETAIFIARLINMPQSGIEKLWIDEVSMPADKAKQTIEQGNFYEIAKRYADYKVRRGAYATRWLYEDGARDEAVVKQMKLFEKKVKERWKKSGSKDLDEMYENLTKQLEPVSKQKERANYLKHTGQYAEYSQAMLNLAKDPNFVAMNIYNHNKSIINRLDNLAMKAQSVEDYKKFRAMSLEQKRALFVTLSAIKNGGTAPDWAINLITSEEPKPETPEPEVIVEEVEVPVYITDDGYEE